MESSSFRVGAHTWTAYTIRARISEPSASDSSTCRDRRATTAKALSLRVVWGHVRNTLPSNPGTFSASSHICPVMSIIPSPSSRRRRASPR